ncbi:MAG: MerR family transcriptional regulator [Anaerolineales bacterium]|nr:MerR family transcriptional regulator [Anaerolineales bacterium]
MNHQELSKKPRYNLNIILQETGIKADTLRAWEKRYQLPVPSRTKGGHRLFSEYDLETVRWLIKRQQEGMRISQAVAYWQELLASNIDPLQSPSSMEGLSEYSLPLNSGGQSLENLQASWLAQTLAFNEPNADQILSQAFAQFRLQTVCLDLILPGLAKIGEGWFEGSITVHQEHFTSELVSRKLQALISTAPQATHAQRLLIGCPAGEFHTIPGLILSLLLRFRGWDVIYLGANIPTAELKDTIITTHPDQILLTATRLVTSAALSRTADFLLEMDIPLTFGGWIFNQIPDLTRQIQGTYLGPDLHYAVPIIEDLLRGHHISQPVLAPKEDFHDLYLQFQSKIPSLKEYLREHYSVMIGSTRSLEALNEGIELLLDDILAGLTFGNLDYLSVNLFWIDGLIRNRKLQANLLPELLQGVREAIRKILDDSAKPILDWLDQKLTKQIEVIE